MDSEKYVEEKLKRIYMNSFIVAGIFLILFVITSLVFFKYEGILSLLLSGFVISIIFGFSILNSTKKNMAIKLITLILVIAAIIGINIGYMDALNKAQSYHIRQYYESRIDDIEKVYWNSIKGILVFC